MTAPHDDHPSNSAGADAARRTYKPRALLYGTLSVLWIFPSLGAIWILATRSTPSPAPSTLVERLRGIGIEHWCAAALLLLHVLFLWLARHYRRTEKPREVPSADDT